jgi:ferritin-like metal-binding protein YciE
MEELRQIYVKKLGKVLDMEKTIIEQMPAMIDMASSEKLHEGLSSHLEETRGHVERIEKILGAHKRSDVSVKDPAFRMMIETSVKELKEIDDIDVRDAAIIAGAQAVEHLEIAKYGTLVEWAKRLDEDGEFINLLKRTLNEEEAADKKLSTVAEGGIFLTGVNEMAAK